MEEETVRTAVHCAKVNSLLLVSRSSRRRAAVIWGPHRVVVVSGSGGGVVRRRRAQVGRPTLFRGPVFRQRRLVSVFEGRRLEWEETQFGPGPSLPAACWLAFPRHVTVRRSAAIKEEGGEESENRRACEGGGGSSAVWPLPKRPADVPAALREAGAARGS